MSVIAWDGKQIAADKLISYGGTKQKGTKLKRLSNGEIIGWVGGHTNGVLMMEWYKNGADPESWPACQTDSDWAVLVVCRSSGIYNYEQFPALLKTRERFTAFGSGKDIALGAMAAGATAVQAVKITNNLSTSCGLGVSSFLCPKKVSRSRK